MAQVAQQLSFSSIPSFLTPTHIFFFFFSNGLVRTQTNHICICLFVFPLNEKQMGWFVLQPITFVFAYFFSLNEKQLWGWFVLKPITHIFESLLIFFDLINKELLNF